MTLYLGCPAWSLKTWVGNFFPSGTKQRDYLAQYSRRFSTVEGNTTFYALPDAATVERWRDETPDGFKFCLKVPQTISHHKRLHGCEAETAQFIDRLQRLRDRCGPAFLQLPPMFTGRNLAALAAFLAAWPHELALAVEPRHSDFFGGPAEADFEALLRQHNAARCIFDTTALFSVPKTYNAMVLDAQSRKPRFPKRTTLTAHFAFVRYVSHPDVPANQPWLQPWAKQVADWLNAGSNVYFFGHHPDDTHAPAVVRLLHTYVQAHTPILPLPTPDLEDHEAGQQQALF